MTEQEFSDAIMDLAHQFEWRAAGFRQAGTGKGWRTPVRYDGKGYVDLTLVHPEHGTVIFAELKSETGTTSPEQKKWGNWLTAAQGANPNVHYRVWKPRDSNEIAQMLTFGRVREWRLAA